MRLLITAAESERRLKTALAVNLATGLAEQEQCAALLVDGDTDSPLSEMPGLSETGMVFNRTGTQVLRESEFGRLKVLTGIGPALADGGEASKAVDKLQTLCAEHDVIVFNGSPEAEVQEALLAVADRVLMVVRPCRTAIQAIPPLLKACLESGGDEGKIQLHGFVPFELQDEEEDHQADVTLRRMAEEFPDAMLWGRLETDAALEESMATLHPVGRIDSGSFSEEVIRQLLGGLRPVAEEPAPETSPRVDLAETIVDEQIYSSSREMIAGVRDEGQEDGAAAAGETTTAVAEEEPRKKGLAALLAWLARPFK